MNKVFILFLTIGAFQMLKAQQLPVDEETGLITYVEVVQQKGDPTVLYDRAEKWVRGRYRNPLNVLGERSRDEGYLNGRAIIRLQDTDRRGNVTPAGVITYSFRIDFRENRYRYNFHDFQFRAASRFPLERWINEPEFQIPSYASYLEQVDNHILETIENLINEMQEKEEEVDEW